MPQPRDAKAIYTDALQDIQTILISTHPEATPEEKLVRIAWVISRLPINYSLAIISQAQHRVSNRKLKPTEFGRE